MPTHWLAVPGSVTPCTISLASAAPICTGRPSCHPEIPGAGRPTGATRTHATTNYLTERAGNATMPIHDRPTAVATSHAIATARRRRHRDTREEHPRQSSDAHLGLDTATRPPAAAGSVRVDRPSPDHRRGPAALFPVSMHGDDGGRHPLNRPVDGAPGPTEVTLRNLGRGDTRSAAGALSARPPSDAPYAMAPRWGRRAMFSNRTSRLTAAADVRIALFGQVSETTPAGKVITRHPRRRPATPRTAAYQVKPQSCADRHQRGIRGGSLAPIEPRSNHDLRTPRLTRTPASRSPAPEPAQPTTTQRTRGSDEAPPGTITERDLYRSLTSRGAAA
jgi:hypothetical protein